MKFGIRQCANIVFRAKQETQIGTNKFHKGQPVLYIDTATTSTLEQASSTSYAQGGRGNARLIAWEGDKTLTFTVTDALISPVSLSMLSGAGLVKESGKNVHVHVTTAAVMEVANGTGTIDLSEALAEMGNVVEVDAGTDAPLFIIKTDDDGSITGDIVTSSSITYANKKLTITAPKWNAETTISSSANVLVDYYIIKASEKVSEIQITPYDFAGYYYVEADTLFRSQAEGVDMPANLTFPNVKLQSNFTIALSSSGDPSTFDFTMDAFPGYTYFDKTKKVLCVIQVIEDVGEGAEAERHSVMLKNSSVEYPDSMDMDSLRAGTTE